MKNSEVVLASSGCLHTNGSRIQEGLQPQPAWLLGSASSPWA